MVAALCRIASDAQDRPRSLARSRGRAKLPSAPEDLLRLLSLAASLCLLAACSPPNTAPRPFALESLTEGQAVHGFVATESWLDAAGASLGGRFVHEASGFTLDLLRIDTAPQGYLWVRTPPSTDKGLPHTQEHLLLGKGNKGRAVAARQGMSLVRSSAFTASLHTAYHLHTVAGTDVYFDVLEESLDALLHPDYTDEEVRREVHHFGVAARGDALELEEKGTVYNEMVSSSQRPWSALWRTMMATLYGPDHPRSRSAGGTPDAIRTITPEDIRAFHARHYVPGNMGLITTLPPDLEPGALLARSDAMLRKIAAGPKTPPVAAPPPPAPGPNDGITAVTYPSHDPNAVGDLVLLWPPTRALAPAEEALLQLFLHAFGGGDSSELYRRFVDSQTRTVSVPISDATAWQIEDDGQPIGIALEGIPGGSATDELAAELTAVVVAELNGIAAWTPESPKLIAFEERMRTAALATARSQRTWLQEPPGFGQRGTGASWFDHLDAMAKRPGFDHRLDADEDLDAALALLEQPGVGWADRLTDWGLLGTAPHILVNRPSPAQKEALDAGGEARRDAFLAALQERTGEGSDEAIASFSAEYDARTAELEAVAESSIPRLVDRLPLSRDPDLDHRSDTVPGTSIPRVSTVFRGTTGASAGLALRLDRVSGLQRRLLGTLPQLMSDVGVIGQDGVPQPHDAVTLQLQREVLYAGSGSNEHPETGRYEIALSGRGTDPEESEAAVRWMAAFLHRPDWRPENLPRIRDVVDQSLDWHRSRQRSAPERWMFDPPAAWRWQTDSMYLSMSSFLTRSHDLLRLRWMLREDGGAAAVILAMGALSDEHRTNAFAFVQGRDSGTVPVGWGDALIALPADQYRLVADAARDLEAESPGLPESSRSADLKALIAQIAGDLEAPPASVLDAMHALRDSILRADGARIWLAGSEVTLAELDDELAALLAPLRDEPLPPGSAKTSGSILARLEQRGVDTSSPTFVGLVDPNGSGGAIVHSAPGPGYDDLDADSLLNLLTARSYGGGGAHSLFMRTWGAGLAYSNGISGRAASARTVYSAERCPRLSQTMAFVVDAVRAADPEPSFGDYTIAQLFTSRAADSLNGRASSMAWDLAIGRTPERVEAFRRALLELRSRDDLHTEFAARLERVYGPVLPGFGAPLAGVEDGVYFVIGTEAELAEYELWLQQVEDPEAELLRLHARDFWLDVEGPERRVPTTD
jgi:predicted Zn-dependent peptidase